MYSIPVHQVDPQQRQSGSLNWLLGPSRKCEPISAIWSMPYFLFALIPIPYTLLYFLAWWYAGYYQGDYPLWILLTTPVGLIPGYIIYGASKAENVYAPGFRGLFYRGVCWIIRFRNAFVASYYAASMLRNAISTPPPPQDTSWRERRL